LIRYIAAKNDKAMYLNDSQFMTQSKLRQIIQHCGQNSPAYIIEDINIDSKPFNYL